MTDSMNERETAIKSLFKYKERLKAEFIKIQDDLKAVERSIELLSEDAKNTIVIETASRKYKKLVAQEAVYQLLKDNPNKRYKSSDAHKELKYHGGFRTSANKSTISSVVSSSLNRLAEHKKIVKEKEEGKPAVYFYVKKEPFVESNKPF